MLVLRKLLSYILFWQKSKDPKKKNVNLKVMHGINKISIVMFLVGVVVIIFKFFK